LKADLDCALPAGGDDIVTVRLRNMVQRGRSFVEVWRMERRLAVRVEGERTVVNVQLQIPRAPEQKVLSAGASWLDRLFAPSWVLELEKKVAGIDFLVRFSVPVYDVPEMPEAPAPLPRAEQPSVLDPAGKWTAGLVSAMGAAAFVAITYQAGEEGWLSTGLMRPSAEWMVRDRFQREFDVWSRSHYPLAIEGRCVGGQLEYRTAWEPIPRQASFWAWYGMSRRAYELKQREYAASGFRLESTTSFSDCSGAERVQAIWLKRGPVPQ
jgi:hypothetical protein